MLDWASTAADQHTTFANESAETCTLDAVTQATRFKALFRYFRISRLAVTLKPRDLRNGILVSGQQFPLRRYYDRAEQTAGTGPAMDHTGNSTVNRYEDDFYWYLKSKNGVYMAATGNGNTDFNNGWRRKRTTKVLRLSMRPTVEQYKIGDIDQVNWALLVPPNAQKSFLRNYRNPGWLEHNENDNNIRPHGFIHWFKERALESPEKIERTVSITVQFKAADIT